MSKNEFKKYLKQTSIVAINRANKMLSSLNLSCSIDWSYNDWGENNLNQAIGVYKSGSVFEGNIEIGFNIGNLYKSLKQQTNAYPWSDEYTILDEIIQTNVFHEVGHGVIDLLNDYLTETDELDELYDENKELFDNVLDNEEDAVEEFAWSFYDNDLNNSQLYNIIKLYLNFCLTENIIKKTIVEIKNIFKNC